MSFYKLSPEVGPLFRAPQRFRALTGILASQILPDFPFYKYIIQQYGKLFKFNFSNLFNLLEKSKSFLIL